MSEIKSRRGGARPGAGRPKLAPELRRTSYTVTMSPDSWNALDEYGYQAGIIARGRIVERLLADLDAYDIPFTEENAREWASSWARRINGEDP